MQWYTLNTFVATMHISCKYRCNINIAAFIPVSKLSGSNIHSRQGNNFYVTSMEV